MRLHISSRKHIRKRSRGIFAMGSTSGFTKEKASTYLSPKPEGRVTKHTPGYGSVWTRIWWSPWSLVSQPLGAVNLSAEGVQNLPNHLILIAWLEWWRTSWRDHILPNPHTWRAHRCYIVMGKSFRTSLPSVDNGYFGPWNPSDMETNTLVWFTHSPPLGSNLVHHIYGMSYYTSG